MATVRIVITLKPGVLDAQGQAVHQGLRALGYETVSGVRVGKCIEITVPDQTARDGVDAVVLPGGFAYGDYLRAGAVAARAPVMTAVRAFARAGGPVLGVCNGFQILLEAGLLPGAMLRNDVLRFRCTTVHVRVESTQTPFTRSLRDGQVLRMPIAHGEGNYFAPGAMLAAIEEAGQVVFRYCDAQGRVLPDANPNGSIRNIAGVCNPAGNVVGLMPHPERASEELLGSDDGRLLFESAVIVLGKRKRATGGAGREEE